ncbi:MAG: aldehyde dehydrogenase family protein, partial [Anaerolineae bacterium]
MKTLLAKLGVQEVNFGACSGPDGWIEDRGGRELVSYNPTTGEALAKVIQATPAAYETLMTRTSQAFETWRLWPAPRRGQVIRDLGHALQEAKEPLGELVSLEMGKIRAEGMGEVQEMVDICEFATGLSRQLYGLVIASERPLHRMMEQWHPLGIVGVISAFNFPVAVWSWNTAIAAVAGDCVLWKPSSDTPLCAVAVQHIANRVAADYGLDGVFNLLIGRGSEVGEMMLNDQRLPLISFTGSTNMGRHVSEAIARRFGRSILELGGNNAIIVTPSADLDMATRAILFGAVGTAGQRCTSTRRIIVHRSISADLINRLLNAYRQVRIGDPLAAGTLMGPLVNQGGVDDMMAALERVRAEGGVILTGGNRLPDKGALFVEPTIVKMPAQTP